MDERLSRRLAVILHADIVGFSGAVAVAPTADRIAYVLPNMEDEWNVLVRRPVGWVHVQDVGGSAERIQLTRGAERSSFPTWSPDGRRRAFLHQGKLRRPARGVGQRHQ